VLAESQVVAQVVEEEELAAVALWVAHQD